MATVSQLTYAVAVDRHRNFSQAAQACFISQPTLSMQIQKLEDELEVTLFDRSRKPVVPTKEGEVLIEQFRAVLREHKRIHELVREIRGQVAGSYRLGVIPTMAPTVLPCLVPKFIAAFPDVALQVEEITTDEIIRRLNEETLDGGILATPLEEPRLTEFVLGREPFVIFHSEKLEMPVDDDGRVHLANLPTDQLIVMREGHCLRTQTLDLCALGDIASQHQRFNIEAGSIATLCAMVREGEFFTVLPAMAANDMRRQGYGHLIKRIAGAVPYREIAFVARRTENRRAIREALIAHARDALSSLETESPPLSPTGPLPPRRTRPRSSSAGAVHT